MEKLVKHILAESAAPGESVLTVLTVKTVSLAGLVG